MSEEDEKSEIRERAADVHRRNLFEEGSDDPSATLIAAVADLRGVDQSELEPLYSWVDGLVGDLYSSPPPPAAQAVVEFSYEGYRIRLYRDGHAVFTDRSTP